MPGLGHGRAPRRPQRFFKSPATPVPSTQTRTADESLATIDESVSRSSIAFLRTAADSLSSITETVSRAAAAKVRTNADSIATLTESVARSVLALLRTAADSLPSLSESASRLAALARTASGTLPSLSEAVTRAVGFVRDTADGLEPFIWGGSQYGSGDAYGGISESIARTLADVRTTSGVIEAISETATWPAASTATPGGRPNRVQLSEQPLHYALSAGDAVEFIYEDVRVEVIESDEWVVLDMPELVL